MPTTGSAARRLAPDPFTPSPDDEIAALEAERDRWEVFVERAEQALAAATEQVKAARAREQQLVSRPVVDGDFDSLVAVWRPLHDVVVELEARETMLLAHVDALRPQAAQAAMAVREAEDRRDCAMLTAAHHAWAVRVAQVQRDFRRAVAEGWRSVPQVLRPRVTVPVSGETYAGYVARVTELAHEAEALRAWALRHPAWQQGIPEPQTVHPETLLHRMLERGTIDDPDIDPTADDDGEPAAMLTGGRVARPVPTVLPGATDDAATADLGTAEVAGSPADARRDPPWLRPAASAVADDAEVPAGDTAGTPPPAAPRAGWNALRGRALAGGSPVPVLEESDPEESAPSRRGGPPAAHRVVVGPRARLGTVPAPAPPVELPPRRRPSPLLLAGVGILVVVVAALTLGVRGLRSGTPARPAPLATARTTTTAPPPPPPAPSSPSVRTAAALVTTGPGSALLFGGTTDGVPLADTWTLTAGRWTARPVAVAPPPRHGAALVDDPVSHRVLLVGGVGAGEHPLGDMWAWDGSAWTALHPAVLPPAAAGEVAVWDPSHNLVDLLVPSAGHLEIWTWNGTVWTHVRATRTPSLAAPVTAAFDAPRHVLLVVGTVSGRPGQAATWTWDGGRWTLHRVVETPLTLDPAGARAAGDGLGGVMLVQPGGAGGQTWRWDGSGWTRLGPVTLPGLAAGSGPVAMGGAASPSGPLLLAPGGGTGLAVWTWTGAGWSPV